MQSKENGMMHFVRMIIVGAAGLLTAGLSHAAEPYVKLPAAQATRGDGKIEVIEFFWYGCEHCYLLEPRIEAWLPTAPKDVVFTRVPAVANERWLPMATMFYTVEALGLLDRLHPRIFNAIHKERLRLEQGPIRDQWLAREGIDRARYAEVEKSFAVTVKVKRARELTHAYRIDGVPALAVNGRYLTGPRYAGGADGVFPAIDKLIELSRKDAQAGRR